MICPRRCYTAAYAATGGNHRHSTASERRFDGTAESSARASSAGHRLEHQHDGGNVRGAGLAGRGTRVNNAFADNSDDTGRAEAMTQLTAPMAAGRTLRVAILLKLHDPAALDKLITAQQDPASPSYRQWLTPASFASRFGPTQDEAHRVTAWLTARASRSFGLAGQSPDSSPSDRGECRLRLRCQIRHLRGWPSVRQSERSAASHVNCAANRLDRRPG